MPSMIPNVAKLMESGLSNGRLEIKPRRVALLMAQVASVGRWNLVNMSPVRKFAVSLEDAK